VKRGVVMSADLALTSGKVLTMNQSQPYAEAVAIKDDRIVQVGANEEIEPLIGENTKVISLDGKTVVPGFIDTHIHVADYGRLSRWIDLSNVASIKEMQECLSRHAAKMPKGKWLIGRGWNQTRFAEKRLPTCFDLDLVSPDNPVIFYQESGQVCVVNNKALELAGVTQLTTVPQGGAIDRDAETGELTGVLRDSATNLVWAVIPEPNEEEVAEATGLACQKIVEAGVTSVHWMVLSPVEIKVIQKLHQENKLPLRVYVVIPASLLDEVAGLGAYLGLEDDMLRVGGVEIGADGYLATRTAALLQPYSDDPTESGRLLCTQEHMNAEAAKILKAGLQLIIHAVGDKAVDVALTTIEKVASEAPRKGVHNRIEQAAVLNEELINRMKKQKVIVSVQPRVIASEFSVWSATEHLGAERAKWLYPVKTLLKEGIRIVGGSDCPMEPLSPLLGVQTVVTRETVPEERVTIGEALRMYTVDAAYSSNEENKKGSVETGKLADLTVLSDDPKKVSPNKIAKIAVEMTIVGGRVSYSKQ
jgi:predicted amidohydrolase YtcJ